jgi:hypothetical protein
VRGSAGIYKRLIKARTGIYMKAGRATYAAFMDPCREKGSGAPPERISVGQALAYLMREPRQFVLRWNGKAAMLSAMFRGVIFLLASLWSHHAGRTHGVMAEALFGALFAGLFGTLAQALRFAEPEWLAELLLAGIFPLLFQAGDIGFHAALGTEVFHASLIASAVFTALSAAFNLYIMRRGTLLVGEEGNPFLQDLGQLPKLVLMFVAAGALRVWRMMMSIGRGIFGDTITSS